MRLRNIKGSREMIAASEYVITQERADGVSYAERYSWSVKGHWNEVFGNDNPVYVEIGMGKGAFLMENARQNPDINYVGIEKFSSVLLRAVQKQDVEKLSNVRLIRMEAENINDVFEPGEVKKLFLNFSDPWPKNSQAARRLTSHQFLERYDKILEIGGMIEFKSDNEPLYEFTLQEIQLANGAKLGEEGEILEEALPENIKWELKVNTRDLHADSELMKTNIMTEYEKRWSSEGKTIFGVFSKHIR